MMNDWERESYPNEWVAEFAEKMVFGENNFCTSNTKPLSKSKRKRLTEQAEMLRMNGVETITSGIFMLVGSFLISEVILKFGDKYNQNGKFKTRR